MNIASPSRRIGFIASFVITALWTNAKVPASEGPKDSRKPAAKCVSIAGLLLENQPAGKWQVTKAGAVLPSGILLVGMPRAELISISGSVRATLLADVGQRGQFPVLEAGVILHDAGDVDMDLTPARGALLLENLKKDGMAKVRLRVRDETWVLQLQTPGTKVGLEVFGRHAPGLRKTIDPKQDVPTEDLLMLVIEGQAFLDTGAEGMRLQAPPGLARLHWDSVLREHSVQRLEKLPEALTQFMNDQHSQAFKDICAATAALAQANLPDGLDKLIHSDKRLERLTGLNIAGAVDDLPRVFAVLAESKDAATRDHAVLVLRNWLGREPGQIQKLHAALTSRKKLTDVQVRNVLHLLLGFDEAERHDPETFALLLAYLDHKHQSVRTLAYWHLVRLAPAGKELAFDASAPAEERQAAVARWHVLIPDGQLPPRPKATKLQKS